MDSLRNLENLVAQVDFKSDSKQDHRAIYSYIEQVVLSPKSLKHVPTLPVIIYSIKNILYPTLATRRIPELLDLLATAEFYRGRTLDCARHALIWDKHYTKTQNPESFPLTDEEKSFLSGLEDEMAELRPIYMRILTMCCHLDMYNLWTSSSPSMTDFLIRFNEYFPFLNRSYDNTSPRLFHFNLTNKEIAQLIDVGLTCCDFAEETVEWVIESQARGQSVRSADFLKPPCEHPDLVQLIDYFVERTRSAAQYVQDMFSENDPLAQ